MVNIIKNKYINIKNGIKALFKLKRCSVCSEKAGLFSNKEYRTVDDVVYCKECAKNKFKFCECCDGIVPTLIKVERKNICAVCFRDRTSNCEDCGRRIFNNNLNSYNNNKLCLSCYNSAYRNFHRIDIGERKEPSKTFIKNPSNRYCGVEIECLNKNRDANCFIRKELKVLRFSQGRDGSLSHGGVEFRSVPMNGDLLFESIEEFGKELNKKHYRVDKTCGLHIHLEVKKELEFLKKLYLFYLRFEDMFFNMLPKSRRHIRYCKRFSGYYKDTPEDIISVKTLDEFKEMLYETSNYSRKIRQHGYDKRYCWANLHSIFYRGTLEIRSHSGTVNPSKIINWISIHQSVLKFLEDKSLEEIGSMKITKKAFLEIFDRPIQNYIKRRWITFIKFEEKDFKIRAPIYVNTKSLGILDGDSAEPSDKDEY